MSVYVNRILNMKKIKAIGFDMDHTIIRYHTENFEKLTFAQILKRLVEKKNYPKAILNLKFNFDRSTQGLMIDINEGNILKLSRFKKVKSSYHGLKQISFKKQQELYGGRAIDPGSPFIQHLDTLFSLAFGIVYSGLTDLKDNGLNLPDYAKITKDVKDALDSLHWDDTLKSEVRKNLKKYIIQDPDIVRHLEFYKEQGKKLLVITNSDFHYTKLLMNFAIDPFLKGHKSWTDLFEIVVTLATKPLFFTKNAKFLKVDYKTGLMSNFSEKITKGIYQGGSSIKIQNDLSINGEEILYLGDHIYGDVVSLKKNLDWRTALVVEPLEREITALKKNNHFQKKIDELMKKKKKLEISLNKITFKKLNLQDSKKKNSLFKQIEQIDSEIVENLKHFQKDFNPYWGELMRAGQEESYFADQVERYACVYVSKVTELLKCSPRTYFRPHRRVLAHEII